MAAPAWAASGSSAWVDGTSLNVPVVSGVTSGQGVIVALYVEQVVTVTPPAGFSELENSPVVNPGAPSGKHNIRVYGKRASGSDSGNYTFSFSATTFATGFSSRFTDVVSSGSLFDSPTDSGVNSSGTTISPATDVTTAGDDRLLIHIPSNWSGGTWTPASGFTQRGISDFSLLPLLTKAQAVAGSSGTVQATCSASDKMSAWLGALIGTTSGGGSPQTVSPSSISSGEAFGSPTVTPGAVILTPAGVSTAEVFGSPVLTPGGVTLSPSQVGSLEAFGTPVVSVGAQVVSPSGIATSEGLGTPTVQAGAVAIEPAGIGSAEQFGAPAVATVSPTWRLRPGSITEKWPIKGSLQTKLTRELTVFGDDTVLYTSEDGYTNQSAFSDEDGAIDATYVWLGGRVNETQSEAIKDLWVAHGFTVEEVT